MISSALLESKTSFKHVTPIEVTIPRGPRPAPSQSLSRAPYLDVTAVINAQRIARDNYVDLQHPNYSKASVHVSKPVLKDNLDVHVLAAADHTATNHVRGHVHLSDKRANVSKGINVRSHGNKPFSEGVKFTDISSQRTAGELMSHAQVRDVLDDAANLVSPDHVRQLNGGKKFDTSVTAHISIIPKHTDDARRQTDSLGFTTYIAKHPITKTALCAVPGKLRNIFDTSLPDTFRSAMRSKTFVHAVNRTAQPHVISQAGTAGKSATNNRYNESKRSQPKNITAAPTLKAHHIDVKSREIQSAGHHTHRDVSKLSFIDRATNIIV
ncbi:proteasome accessory factor [European chub iridovirus]|nr:proteasome accessory factor [European chub iridovirus]